MWDPAFLLPMPIVVWKRIAVGEAMFFFAFSTIISWNLFGKINFTYLFGKKSTIVYSVLSVAFIFLGSLLSNDLVWECADLFNYLMVIPNALALLFLSKTVIAELKENGRKNFYETPNAPISGNIDKAE